MKDDHFTNHYLPNDGEFFVRYGIVYSVVESDLIDCEDDGTTAWTIYTEKGISH